MSAGRFTMLPETGFAPLRPGVEARLAEAARQTCGEGFDSVFDGAMRALLTDCFTRIGGHEGTVWLFDASREALIPRFNTGANAAEFVGSFRQSLRSGMISMVAVMAQAICENDVHKNARQDKALDERLALETCSMLAVPFYFVGQGRGVISCVQLRRTGSTEQCGGFSADDLLALQFTASILSRLIEARLLALCLGLEGLA
jgi:hypothetical protein